MAHLSFLSMGLTHIVHDLKNHLAIINETAGLMMDLIKLKNKYRFRWGGFFFKRCRGGCFDIKPFMNELNTIQKQVFQESTLVQDLGRFAHSLNKNKSVFEGHRALVEVQDLLLAHAREKGVHLEIKLSKTASKIETEPLGFQVAVLWNVELAMAGLKSGHRVNLETGVREGSFQLCITSPYLKDKELSCSVSEEPGSQGLNCFIMKELGCQIQERSGYGKHIITIAFPLADAKT